MKTIERSNVKSYLDLIQELLSCPQGEEWILLRKHGDLVNSELVEVMEQVARYLGMQGKTRAANYLHNWAGQLHHILSENIPIPEKDVARTNAYVQLIHDLLNCPQGSESEILAAHRNLIDPELIRVMHQLASQMSESDPSTANYLHSLAADLERTWIEHHEFDPTLKAEIAPDPWLDQDSASSDSLTTASNPDESNSNETTAAVTRVTETPASSTTAHQIEPNQSLISLLTQVASSLARLETTLTHQLPSQNPLWYMEVLEKAIAANWILSSDEVEKLIGVKPHCHHDQTYFARGIWIFTKEGKIGAQIGWRVSKKDS